MTRKRSGPKPETARLTGAKARPAAAAASTTAADPASSEGASAASQAKPAESQVAPIIGVASGSLGTGANLDDTQVMRTADLQRAAAEVAVPVWLTGDAPPLPDEEDAWAGEAVVGPAAAARAVPVREHVQPPERVQAREPVKPRQRAGSGGGGRRTGALAGAIAGALLVLVVGAALLGAMGGFGTNPPTGGAPLADATGAPAAMPTTEPTKEPKGCHGKGKGNDCKD